jgi:hypothetical protein
MSRPRRSRRGRTTDPRHRASMAELANDPDYLTFKESIGEPLAASERAALDAHRQGRHYRAFLESLDTAGPGGEP